MRIRKWVGQFTSLIGRRKGSACEVRYTPECAYCGVPDGEAFRYPGGWSVCRECHAAECCDGI